MKKIILTIAALLSTVGLASPIEKIDYTNAFTKMENIQEEQYNKVTITVKNKDHHSITLIDGSGKGQYLPNMVLDGKYLSPKSADNVETITFTTTLPELTDDIINELKTIQGETLNGNTVNLNATLYKYKARNNTPIFIYVYDKTNNVVHKIYKEDGTRAVIRQVNSEDVNENISPKTLKDGSFEIGNGYVEANDLYKLMIGEIKDNDPSKTGDDEIKDRSRHGVSGKTVYDYLNSEKSLQIWKHQ